MKKKSIIIFLSIMVCALFLGATTDTDKAMELIKKGNESFQVYNNLSLAFTYFKQAADLASGYIKVEALLQSAYMSHLQGNKIQAFQNYIKEALNIDPETKLERIDYRDSFIQIFNDIRSRETTTIKQAVTKTAPKSSPVQPQSSVTKPAPKLSPAQPQPSLKKEAGKAPQKQKPLKVKTANISKYLIKISYAMGMAGSDQNQSWSESLYGENAEYSVTSKIGKGSNFNLSFGYNLNKAIGIGLGAIIHSSDLDATVNASVPNPWIFNSPRSANGAYATTLKATIFYLDFIYMINFNKFSLGLFAGPAYFNSSAEVISGIEIQEVFPNDTVTISFSTEKVKKSSFGFTGGLDLNYFFSSHLGVFVEGRYLSGSSTFTPSSQKVPGIKLTVGGLNVGAGLVYQF